MRVEGTGMDNSFKLEMFTIHDAVMTVTSAKAFFVL